MGKERTHNAIRKDRNMNGVKNRKTMMKWIGSLAMILVLAAALCACSGSKDSSGSSAGSENGDATSNDGTPAAVAEQLMTALQKDDTDTIAKIYEGGAIDLAVAFEDSEDGGDSSSPSALQEAMDSKLSDFDYEIGKETIDGDTATVKVKATTYAFGDAIEKYYEDYQDQVVKLIDSGASDKKIGELSQSLLSEQLSAMKKNCTGTFTMNLTKSGDSWMVDEFGSDSDFYRVMSGKMTDAMKKLEQ